MGYLFGDLREGVLAKNWLEKKGGTPLAQKQLYDGKLPLLLDTS